MPLTNKDIKEFLKTKACSRTSGILKSPSRSNRALDNSHIRISVTFQNETMNELYSADNIHSEGHLQPSRSVTFSDLHSAQQSEHFQPSKYSVSGTIVYGHEQGSAAALSVLSSLKRDSTESHAIAWGIQTEAIKTAVDEIIDTRDAYLDIHHSNPGLFTEVIFTDNFPESLEKLSKLLKKCIEKQPTAKPNYQFPKDAVYQKMVASRLELLHKEINSELSITQKQLDTMARRKSLKGKGKKSNMATEKQKPQVGFSDAAETDFDKNDLDDLQL